MSRLSRPVFPLGPLGVLGHLKDGSFEDVFQEAAHTFSLVGQSEPEKSGGSVTIRLSRLQACQDCATVMGRLEGLEGS